MCCCHLLEEGCIARGVLGRAQVAGEMFQGGFSPNSGMPGPGTLVPCRLDPSSPHLLPPLTCQKLAEHHPKSVDSLPNKPLMIQMAMTPNHAQICLCSILAPGLSLVSFTLGSFGHIFGWAGLSGRTLVRSAQGWRMAWRCLLLEEKALNKLVPSLMQ